MSQHKRQLITAFFCPQLIPEFVVRLQFFWARKKANFEHFFNLKIRCFLLKKGGSIERVTV
jgi:hypothetical protein